tara:strand:- start:130 stop:1209 length:1080 start_codon:yes stop_codon:yes gene_type:complete
MPTSSDVFDLAWSVAKSDEADFDIDEYFLHRKGILDFIEDRGRDMKERYLRELGILPSLEQPLTEQPVVAVPDVRGEARGEGGIEPPMEGRQMDEGPKNPRQEPKPKVREAKEETPKVQPEDKVEPAAPKEEVGMPIPPPVEKPPVMEDIVEPPKKIKDVASKPPPKKPKAKSVKKPAAKKVKNTASKVPKSKTKPMPEKVATPAKKKDDFKIPRFISEGTDRDIVERIANMAEDGNEEAYKTLLNNSGELEDYFPDIHERYEEIRSQMQKSFILKDPFANPFHNPNFLDTVNIRKEMAEPMSPIIKSQPTQEQVKPDIGFDTVEGDDLSLLPASIFMGQDNSVGMDDMSLLPTGWRNE